MSNVKRLMKLVASCSKLEGNRVSERRTADWNVATTVDLYNTVKKYFECLANIRIQRHKQ